MILTKQLVSLTTTIKELSEKADILFSDVPGGVQLSKAFIHLASFADRNHEESAESSTVVDVRVKQLLMRNFRKYRRPSNSRAHYFGASFTVNDKQASSFDVLLGSNGVGKSTLFDAAELLCTKKIGEAEYRCIDMEDFYKGGSEQSEIRLITNNGDYSSLAVAVESALPLENFFISENSIVRLLSKIRGTNFFPFFCNILGVGNLYELSTGELIDKMLVCLESKKEASKPKQDDIMPEVNRIILEGFITPTDTISDRIAKNLKACINKLRAIHNLQKNADVKPDFLSVRGLSSINMLSNIRPFAETLSELSQIEKMAKSTLSDAKEGKTEAISDKGESPLDTKALIERYRSALEKLSRLLEYALAKKTEEDATAELSRLLRQHDISKVREQQNYDEIAKQVDEFSEKLRKIKAELPSALSEYLKGIITDEYVSTVKELFKDTFIKPESQEDLAFDISKIDNGEISIMVNGITANRYFNTFRFRLLFIMIQTVTCVSFINTTRISFPIFIDDIFYANDYRNKEELYKYFVVLENFAKKLFSNNGCHLQVLFFTHDEQLSYSLLKRNGKSEESGYTFGRIMEPILMDNLYSAEKEIIIDSDKTSYIDVYVKTTN